MRSKNSARITAAEGEHLGMVKTVGCVVCDAAGPNEAHHINQGDHFTTVAVCASCHTGSMGIHGDKTMWRIHKLDELKALNLTLARVDSLRRFWNGD